MAKAPTQTREVCDACRHDSLVTLQRVTIERVEVKICPEPRGCLRRAETSGLYMLREAI